jgi:hypothetical protein
MDDATDEAKKNFIGSEVQIVVRWPVYSKDNQGEL